MSQEPYIQHHEQNKQGVLSGTGQWLLADSEFVKWKKESASSILWLHGILGSGKSKLV
jgi:adenylylsulfate kinase-like enzyme